MKDLTVIGIDIAKNVFQIHGADSRGKKLIKKRVSREGFIQFMGNLPVCLVGMEACGSAHFWAKELIKLGFDVKLMSPLKVKNMLTIRRMMLMMRLLVRWRSSEVICGLCRLKRMCNWRFRLCIG